MNAVARAQFTLQMLILLQKYTMYAFISHTRQLRGINAFQTLKLTATLSI